jgi:hypothetical protein
LFARAQFSELVIRNVFERKLEGKGEAGIGLWYYE